MQWLSVEVHWPLGVRFFMTSNRSFSNEASSQLTPLHAALAGTSLGTTTTSRGINHSLASEMLVIYSKIYASLILARRETRGGNLLLSGTVYLSDLISIKLNSIYNLRSISKPLLDYPKGKVLSTLAARSFSVVHGLHVPAELRQATSLISFKSRLKTYLFKKYFYNL